MPDTTTRARPAPHAPIINRDVGDGIERAMTHAAEWLRNGIAKSQSGIFSESVAITPEMAALLLKKNPDNRNLSKRRIAEIRADLERGRYVLNGEPIIVSKDGLLNDGQHRLIACVESGVTFRSMVTFGVGRSTRLTLDQGGARKVSDYLDMQGCEERSNVVATVSRMLWQQAKFGKLSKGGGISSKHKVRTWPTKAEILLVANECEREIAQSIAAIQKSSRFVGSYSFVVFCRIILCRADQTMGPVFMDRLLDGANLKSDSPIFLLRERFINDPRMPATDRYEAVVRAWNAMRKGKPISKIQVMGNVPAIEG